MPISYFQGAMLGLLQGVSELFPVSSLGHSVILPKLVGWHIKQNADYFLTFLVATHLATALVLLGFFWRDWWRILKGLGRSLPSFFPGHEAGSNHHHVKHGIASFLVGLACFAFAWFNTGPKKSGTGTPDAG